MKNKLVISFSGGRTSAYMMWWLLNEWEERHEWDIVVVFANTGKEVEGTLFFVDECATEWGIDIVWLEGYPSEGWSVKHKIVDYKNASRNGEPFEAMIKKLGVPSTISPFCSPQLKRETIKSYLRSINWKNYHVAIGIRVDEDRVDPNWISKRIMYPLIFNNPVTKRDVILWWEKQPFNLEIHPDDGNCDNCWKKDTPRLVRNYIRRPQSYNWWDEMVQKYGHLNPRNVDLKPPFNFFRGNIGVPDIRNMAEMSQAELKQLSMFDKVDSCNESCEVF